MPLSAIALFVDRVKDAVLNTITVSVGDTSESLRILDECNIADGFVGWVVLSPKGGSTFSANVVHIALLGANRMRIRG